MSDDPPPTPPPDASPGPHTAGGGRWQPPSPEELEQKLPQYQVIEVLGVGGMGAVYKGFQTSLERYVAIKILSPGLTDEDVQYAERFKQEAKTMARLSHPGIVSVFDFGETVDGLYYIVMEFVEGTDVQQMITGRGRLEPAHALAIALHVCDALAYAHRHGIVHRDIKPANVMVDSEGRVKVADFGLAKGVQPGSSMVTGTGKAMGTPDFVAPEALIIGTVIDQRADLYAMGVMLYQMLTGKVPRGRFENASARVPGLDPRYDAVVDRAMQEERESRYASAEALRADLTAILTAPLPQRMPAPTQTPASAQPQRPQPGARFAPPAAPKSAAVPALIGIATAALIAVVLLAWKPWAAKENVVAERAAAAVAAPEEAPPPPAPGKAPNPPPRDGPPDSRPPGPPRMASGERPGPGDGPRRGDPPPRPPPSDRPPPAVSATLADDKPKTVVEQAPPAPPSELDQRLAVLDQGFQAAVERDVQTAHRDAVAALDKGYSGALERALTTAAQAGQTDVALALREEKQHLEKGADVPAEDDEKTPDTLKALRKTYRSARAQRDLERIKNLQPLFDKYEQALASLTLELTKAGKLDDAVRVKVVREDIARARITGATGTAVIASAGAKTSLSGPIRGFTNSLGMKFVPVPGTSVLFCIHETRRKDYAVYAAAERGVPTDWKSPMRNGALVGTGGDDEPVVEVDWQRAVDFCAWLSKREGRTYRLPTDREWSFAVGIGDQEAPDATPASLDSKIKDWYPWGKTWPPPKGSANLLDESFTEKGPGISPIKGYNDGFPTLAPVMSFKPNDLGIYDLAGNVWEWCSDWSDEKRKDRVVRGGSWWTAKELSSRRLIVNPGIRVWDYGFRCVVEPEAGAAPVPTVSANSATAPAPAVVATGGAKTKLSGLARSFTNTLGMKFVPVPGTNVLFCIHETRRRDYAVYAAANPGVDKGWRNPKRDGVAIGSGSEDDPVVFVTWDDSKAFCDWLSKQEGRKYRLPTDREWSFAAGIAARESPTATPNSLSGKIKGEYTWGNKWPPPKNSGNYQDEAYKEKFPEAKSSVGYNDGFATTAPVMSFKPDNLGLYDLAGNVAEWCEDWGDETHKGRVSRGGSWSTVNLLSSSRNSQPQGLRTAERGFRCVVEPDK